MHQRIPITVSLNRDIVQQIDNARGDIPRSRMLESLVKASMEMNRASGSYGGLR